MPATSPTAPASRLLAVLALLAIPSMLVVPASHVRSLSGPFWSTELSDPSYAYLMNAALVATGRTPVHIDHPGTPLHVLGASVIHARHALLGTTPLAASVVQESESYLLWIHWTLLFGVAMATILMGFAAWRRSKSLPLAIICQFAPFACFTTWRQLVFVSPEPLLFILSLSVGAALLFHSEANSSGRAIWPAVFGILTGTGIATKVTFAPIFVAPLLVMNRGKSKLLFVLATAATVALATLPIWERYEYVVSWLSGLVTHQGRYGSGPVGFDARFYLSQLRDLLRVEYLLSLIAVVIGAAAIAVIRRRQSWLHRQEFVALASALALQFLVVAKHSAERHLISSIGLMGVSVALLHVEARMRWPRIGRAMIVSSAAIVSLMTVLCLDNGATYAESAEIRRQRADSLAEVARKMAVDGRIILHYGASERRYAVLFGNHLAGNAFGAATNAAFPNTYLYWPWGRTFTNSAGERVAATEILDTDLRTYFRGYAFEGEFSHSKPAGMDLYPMTEERGEAIYEASRILPSSARSEHVR